MVFKRVAIYAVPDLDILSARKKIQFVLTKGATKMPKIVSVISILIILGACSGNIPMQAGVAMTDPQALPTSGGGSPPYASANPEEAAISSERQYSRRMIEAECRMYVNSAYPVMASPFPVNSKRFWATAISDSFAAVYGGNMIFADCMTAKGY
jgi:hypothetical protein